MCGRYTLVVSIEQLMELYMIENLPEPFRPRYNIAPMQNLPAVIHDGQKNRMGQLRWGLLPSWAKEDGFGAKMINARAETLMEKPSFKNLVVRKRAIIPADGFYEWKQLEGRKQPMRITMKNESVFSMAALYDTWDAPDGSKISTCTIITTTPNTLVQSIHNRMPVILHRKDEEAWLDRDNTNVDQLLSLLVPYPSELMQAYPVTEKVGNVRNDTPDLIDKLG